MAKTSEQIVAEMLEQAREQSTEASATFFDTMVPWIAALSMVREEALAKGLPPDVADDLVRQSMRMWGEEIR